MTVKPLQIAIEKKVNTGQKAFIPYIMAGDGGLKAIRKQILFLQDAGATAIEVGIPFTDPVADGPVIEEAGNRALKEGANLKVILAEIAAFKEEIQVPLIVMTYLNPILAYGIEKFVAKCEEVGITGLIIPDVPIEEAKLIQDKIKETSIALIQLVSLTSKEDRIQKIAEVAEGFIYAVTVNGITGVRSEFGKSLDEHIHALKEISTVPVIAGFGISTPEQVEEIGSLADGVIVGSAIVKAFHEGNEKFIRELIPKVKVTE
ncbi:tryptophan synthase subunit alpha [Rummeliibacillus sp. TYF005]|uniref:tryptophan synthase subunit alpha n=1 Tax=unclassified Rummeliibacillus TaxID=2622809 RepID=UPI000E66268D|nr:MULTISPECIES: tryptophan synthase subunit alpha [unclassified Rummeliibacillus]RIJ63494.1 tryptophan synthase subunit alpha [Rummeliibacillus sp. POC4]RPJ96361.1 tryptophan synthase subunit alpha [Rummeliibacillus sp. TYF005]